MQFKVLGVLAICVFISTPLEAVANEKQLSHDMLNSLKLCHVIEEAGSDTYAVGGNLNCENLLEHTGR